MTNPSKARGTKFETDVQTYLRANLYEAERLPTTGSKDEGDLVLRLGGVPFVLEIKNCAKLNLAGWVREAAIEAGHFAAVRKIDIPHFVVVHKKRNAPISQAYVTTTLREWLYQVDQVPF